MSTTKGWWRLSDQIASNEIESLTIAGTALNLYDFLNLGTKVVALLALIRLSVIRGDKLLVLTQSIATLEVIEWMLNSCKL